MTTVSAALNGGVTAVQLRCKGRTDQEFLNMAKAIRPIPLVDRGRKTSCAENAFRTRHDGTGFQPNEKWPDAATLDFGFERFHTCNAFCIP